MQTTATLNKSIGQFDSAKQTPQHIIVQDSSVAGIQYHQGRRIWPRLSEGDALRLKRENDNPNDHHAIAVFFRNYKIGYVPRRENKMLARFIDEKRSISAAISRLSDTNSKEKIIDFRVEMEIQKDGLIC